MIPRRLFLTIVATIVAAILINGVSSQSSTTTLSPTQGTGAVTTAGGGTTAAGVTTAAPGSTAVQCADDPGTNCASLAAKCNDPAYSGIMHQFCQATCGFCGGAGGSTNAPPPTQAPPCPGQDYPECPQWAANGFCTVVPFTTPIYEGFNHDAHVEIHGEVFAGPQNGFVVEFTSHEGIPLHIAVRMGEYGTRKGIFVNHLKHGRWHAEIFHHNHLCFGQHFHMKIENHHRHFSIHVNGAHICKFHHHSPPKHIHAMTVRGDMRIHKVHFDNFNHMNGGGIAIGGGVMPVPMSAPMVAPMPVPIPVPQPAPVVMPQPIYVPQPYVAQPEVIVIEEGHHHQ
ncbi:hypothetical protein WR25_13160 [Diploscapter pachys]|uniref:Galectin n=1 Tax=Diploscapter pachys TaxID=2018661 RepID=A0A2A2LQK0_9BILA|nr:hypothetical protein WR25_13160 [Diploscapter pachys]